MYVQKVLNRLNACPFKMSNPSSFTCMCPHVGLEVGALEVGLVAVLAGTNVTAHTGHFWLQWALSLLQQGTARCGGDVWQLGSTRGHWR